MTHSRQNRRDFFKTGLAGIAGAAALSSTGLMADDSKSKVQKLVYRTLGKTGLKLPVISMGTGDTNDPGLVKAALDSGIKLLATSPYYGDGNNERMLGQIMKDRDRDSVVIMTSVLPDGVDHKNGLFTDASKMESMAPKLEASLERLGVEYVDILLLPFAAKKESVFFEPLLKGMEQIKKQGKARFLGIATHSWEPEAIRAAADTKIYDVIMTAYNFRRQNYKEIQEAVAYAADAGLGIIAMKTMAGAFWDKERTQPINSKASLKWVLQNSNIHTTVPGITTYEQITSDVSVMEDLSLSDKEKADLKLSFNDPNSPYCQQCGTCVSQCKKGLDIPTLMRSHMYAYGYRNLSNAKETLIQANLNASSCDDCGSCDVRCTMGYNVRSKIMDIARLKDVHEDFLV